MASWLKRFFPSDTPPAAASAERTSQESVLRAGLNF